MNKKEQEKYLKEFRKFGKELIKSKKKAAKFLQSAGIHTKQGNLTKRYKNSPVAR